MKAELTVAADPISFPREASIRWLMRLTTYLVVGATALIIISVASRGFSAISLEFLTAFPKRAGAEGGIFPAIVGTICLVGGAAFFALPLGVGAAIFLTEYSANSAVTRAIRLAIVTLAGVPSIVFGLFGLGLFVQYFGFGPSILSGSLTLACMILPTIIVASEEALRAVPLSMRDASLALGATKWQAIRLNVLPYALPGILTGAILGVGRAAGETAPILLTAVAFFLPRMPHSIFDQVMALPYHLFILQTQFPDASRVLPKSCGTALVLLFIVLGLNFLAIILRIRLRRRYKW